MKMKTNVAVQTANDCIRHVLKDAYAELEYKYVKETRKQSLLDRIEHLENVLEKKILGHYGGLIMLINLLN